VNRAGQRNRVPFMSSIPFQRSTEGTDKQCGQALREPVSPYSMEP